jgi:uncharacterized protein (TIGR03067 family)
METTIQLMTGQLQALSLSILLLFSFVLPWTAKARAPKDGRIPRLWMRKVWAGQLLMALGGLSKRTAGILSFSIAVLLGASGCSTLHKSDLATLQGTWKGQEIGVNTEGECCLVVSGTTLAFVGVNTNEWYKGTFTLREDINPKKLAASITECCVPKYDGKTSYGLYRIEDGTLTLTANEPGSPAAPSGFDAPDARHFVLRKKLSRLFAVRAQCTAGPRFCSRSDALVPRH